MGFCSFRLRSALMASEAVRETDVMFNQSDQQVQKKTGGL